MHKDIELKLMIHLNSKSNYKQTNKFSHNYIIPILNKQILLLVADRNFLPAAQEYLTADRSPYCPLSHPSNILSFTSSDLCSSPRIIGLAHHQPQAVALRTIRLRWPTGPDNLLLFSLSANALSLSSAALLQTVSAIEWHCSLSDTSVP